jgi:hypothetical protein
MTGGITGWLKKAKLRKEVRNWTTYVHTQMLRIPSWNVWLKFTIFKTGSLAWQLKIFHWYGNYIRLDSNQNKIKIKKLKKKKI